MHLRTLLVSTSLVLAACSGENDTGETFADAPLTQEAGHDGLAANVEASVEASVDAGVETADPAPVEAEDESATDADEEEISVLDQLADDICQAGDAGFSSLLGEGQGFASRGADARVHTAWNIEGERVDYVTYTPDLDDETRRGFDNAVADFLRLNLTPGVDRTGLTGAYRSRDGRFCVVQTDGEAVEALRQAVLVVQ